MHLLKIIKLNREEPLELYSMKHSYIAADSSNIMCMVTDLNKCCKYWITRIVWEVNT